MNGIYNIINNIKDSFAESHRAYLLIISSRDYVVSFFHTKYYKYTVLRTYTGVGSVAVRGFKFTKSLSKVQ